MKSTKTVLIAVGLTLACGPAWSQEAAPAPARGTRVPQANWWSQAGGDAGGPTRIVWAGQKTPETPYTGPNKPIWHIADILKAHKGQARWEQKVLLNRDFDGRYVQMAPGDKSKCIFYADDRVFGWVYSGQVKITIDGQEPKTLPKGWVFNVAPRLSYCMETVGTEPVVFYRTAPAGQVPSYPIRKAKRRRLFPATSMSKSRSPRPAAMTHSTCLSSMLTSMARRIVGVIASCMMAIPPPT
jgi:hypothetical protein